ncbi:MAG: hypothetical protein RLY71_3706 [Pseudomonadota bacterium]|jgi:hypothetical protein
MSPGYFFRDTRWDFTELHRGTQLPVAIGLVSGSTGMAMSPPNMMSRKSTGAFLNIRVATIAFALLASGCGGSDGPMRTDFGKVHYYDTNFRQNQLVSLMMFEGGLVYGFYQDELPQQPSPEFTYAGFFVASRGAQGSSDSVRVGKDYRFNTRETFAISLSDFAATDQALSFGIESNQGTENLQASRETTDELDTNSASLPGTYLVQARSTVESLKGNASIGESGALQIELPGACQVTGLLAARPKGNLYDTSVKFASGCSLASGKFSGHAFQSFLTGVTYVMLTSTTGDGVLLLLTPAVTP